MVAADVRCAGAHDVTAIGTVLAAAYAEFTADFTPTALRQRPADIADHLDRWLIAREEGRVVACLCRYPEEDYFTFCFLATEPALRRRGHGSALVGAAVTDARAAGRTRVRIALRRSLSGNIDFFARRGFRYLEPFPTGAHDLYQLEVPCPP